MTDAQRASIPRRTELVLKMSKQTMAPVAYLTVRQAVDELCSVLSINDFPTRTHVAVALITQGHINGGDFWYNYDNWHD